MRISTLLVLSLAVLLSSCGGGGSSAETAAADLKAPVQKSTPTPSVSDVLAKIYDSSYSAPSDFFVDARSSTQQSYSMHHVLDASGAFERCTNDYATALDWESADNDSRSVRGTFVAAIETDRYFEVARELAYTDSVGNIDDLTSPGFGRVFKCSNTARDGVDRHARNGFAGHINVRPLSDTSIREFSQYLWQFAFFPTARKKVLETYSSSTASSLQHSLVLGFANSGGANGCDRIEVVNWSSTADRQTGAVTQSWLVLDTFEAKLEAGGPVLCGD